MRCSMQGSGRSMTYIELLTGNRFAVRDCVRLPEQLDSSSRLKGGIDRHRQQCRALAAERGSLIGTKRNRLVAKAWLAASDKYRPFLGRGSLYWTKTGRRGGLHAAVTCLGFFEPKSRCVATALFALGRLGSSGLMNGEVTTVPPFGPVTETRPEIAESGHRPLAAE